ncbi:MAG TPA: aminotransferase class III-fold pyridoxal phosphate-dependent enzyme [Acetobacteraceae bacterium]|jgi:glutamate-1-semialdehyde 2,1-aminomutase|nr:aminotransferase class III-fold pyridoxal phosphate-dependent enzyme [Acetobacteraceae bacterium]
MATLAAVNADLNSALEEARADFTRRNPKSCSLYDEACQELPGGNTRTALYYPPFPLTMLKGEGARLWDADGHRYTDFLNEFTAGVYGHSDKTIQHAIERAFENGVNRGAIGELEVKLARLIRQRFPSMELVRFVNSGTEANLLAIQLARAYTRRPKIMVFEGGYHGAVFSFSAPNNPMNAPFDYVRAQYNDIDATLALIESNAAELAVTVIEPMQAGGGCIAARPAFLEALRDACAKHHILLLFDEVVTSRLGPGGLQAMLGIVPDLTSMGKYIGGGLNFGVFGGRADVMSLLDARRPDALSHAGTFNNNVLTMAAGCAGFGEVYTAERAVALNSFGDRLRNRLNELCRKAGLAMQFTGMGSVMNVHFCAGELLRYADTKAGSADLKDLFFYDLLERGIYLARRGMMALSLPLAEADGEALLAAVNDFQKTRGSLIPKL